MITATGSRNFLIFGLPALLFLVPIATIGAFYETNDDIILTFLFQGIITGAPVTELLYFMHGIGWLLAKLYRFLPGVPWYGLVMYFLLWVATVQAAYLLIQSARNHKVSLAVLIAPAAILFWGAWLEHIVWFNFSRVSILLAGVSVLLCLAAVNRRPEKKWLPVLCIAFFLIALMVRARGGLLGLGLAAPAALWMLSARPDVKKTALWLSPFVALTLLFQVYNFYAEDAEQKHTRELNRQKSLVNDYRLFSVDPDSYADSVAFVAIQKWVMADEKVVNAGLFARAEKGNTTEFLRGVALQKAINLVKFLVRDYFILMFLQGILLLGLFGKQTILPWRKLFLCWQVLFWVFLVGLGTWLKLPPRIASSALSVHCLALICIWLKYYPGRLLAQKWQAYLLVALVLIQGYKIGHRTLLRHEEIARHEKFLAAFSSSFPGKIVVTAWVGDFLFSLSPFKNYSLGPNTTLNLSGWPSLLPYYKQQLRQLTGTTSFTPALLSLTNRPDVVWMLPKHFPVFLTTYFRVLHHTELTFTGLPQTPPQLDQLEFYFYHVQSKPAR